MTNFLCFDLGTTKIKSALINDSANILLFNEENAKNYHKNSILYQNPQDYYYSILNFIKKVKSKLPSEFRRVGYIICSTQMGGVLGIDDEWNVVFPWTYSVDTNYLKYLSRIDDKFGEKIRDSSGGTPTMAGKILWIMNEYPDIYIKISKFINLSTYVSGKLCSLKSDNAFIDYSCLTMTGFADIKNGIWNKEILNALDIDLEKLPKIVKPYETVGIIDKDVFGTLKDIKVLAGIGDQVAGFIGAGIVKSGDIVDVAGTYHVLGYCTNKFVSDPQERIVNTIYSGISDLYYQIGIISVSGAIYKWFMENFNNELKDIEVGSDNNIKTKYKVEVDILKDKYTLDDDISVENPFFIPHFGGRLSPSQPYFKGAWVGIGWEHNLKSFYLSMLEANGYELYYVLEHIKKLNYLDSDFFSEIKVIGGGSKNNVENQIKANILNLKYIKPNNLQFEIIGDYLIAKYNDNVINGYKDLQELGVVWNESEIEPENEKVNFYIKKRVKYKKVIEKLDELFSEI